MKRAQIYFFFFILTTATFAQSLAIRGEIGNFEDASSFAINPAGYIFVADKEKNEIYKFDTLGNQLKFIGGYGWSESSFDYPSDIFATTLNVYVTDKNNHRIQIFDKDLNYLSQFKTDDSENSDLQFGYPECAAVSNQGDLYILDTDNSRILKYGLSGNFLLEIGGNDAGNYSLSNPKSFAVSEAGKIFVIDSENITIFDQYGTGLGKMDIDFEAVHLSISKNLIFLNSDSEIKLIDLMNPQSGLLNIKMEKPIADISIKKAIQFNNELYVLTENSILIYNYFN